MPLFLLSEKGKVQISLRTGDLGRGAGHLISASFLGKVYLFAQWLLPPMWGFKSTERIKGQWTTDRWSLSPALFVPPTEDLVELFKLAKDKRLLVCQ